MGFWHPSSTRTKNTCLLSKIGLFQTAAELERAASFPISSFHQVKGRWEECKRMGSVFYTPPLTWEMHLGEGPYVIHTSATRQRQIFGEFYHHPLICRLQGEMRAHTFLTLDGPIAASGYMVPTTTILFRASDHRSVGMARGHGGPQYLVSAGVCSWAFGEGARGGAGSPWGTPGGVGLPPYYRKTLIGSSSSPTHGEAGDSRLGGYHGTKGGTHSGIQAVIGRCSRL